MRVLLINPPSPEQLGSPLLGLQYVAAALQGAGCEVRVIDAAARRFGRDGEWIAEEAARWQPRVIGFGLFTRWVWHAYRLASKLRNAENGSCWRAARTRRYVPRKHSGWASMSR
jgi:hypothetical protein